MPRALVIEDDEVTARDIVAELGAHGLTADWVANGRDGLQRALADGYDIITLDRMLPGMDGIDVVSELRKRSVETPVLMISALSDVDERVRGLRAGGDDYLTKPFSPDELAARAEVLLRRRRSAASTPETRLRVDDLELDLVRHNALRKGKPLTLLPTEFRLLEFLMRNAGQVVTRQMIFEHVWGFHFDPGTNVIDVHIGRLRRKIDGAGEQPLIRTVRGSGYLLAPAD
ncbi:response regulator transcription factor [Luteibacter anthropi]|uniref:Response regulator transcription factor n=1 Tax=Luteibacter anthropi TaxID=564369 RepID=A0A7X5UDH0_9GAMM|nr:response regulator transcription factor [Luteibacter anthropi]NII08198.1 response regulator transcription factor [Luteibacter anthropi]URX64141.1 response regulator transcription factor [Luteibacter anthropi]